MNKPSYNPAAYNLRPSDYDKQNKIKGTDSRKDIIRKELIQGSLVPTWNVYEILLQSMSRPIDTSYRDILQKAINRSRPTLKRNMKNLKRLRKDLIRSKEIEINRKSLSGT